MIEKLITGIYYSRECSHCGLAGGPVRVKEDQSESFEEYLQMVLSRCKEPSNGSSWI